MKPVHKLHEIPKGSKIYELMPNGDEEGVIIFDHLDGMYSYCYVESDPSIVVHLFVGTELEEYKDGYRLYDRKD